MSALTKGNSPLYGNGLLSRPAAGGTLKRFAATCGSNCYDSFVDKSGSAYVVPISKKLVVLRVSGRSQAAAANFYEMGSGTASVSNSTSAPTGSSYSGKTPLYAPFSTGDGFSPASYDVLEEFAAGRYPYIKAATNSGVTVNVDIEAIEVDA